MVAICFAALFPPQAQSQELIHMEGYFINSIYPAVNPNPGVNGLEGRGLITALYSPLTSNFVANEYTWVIKGLLATSTRIVGTQSFTNFDTSASSFSIYEDPTLDARPTFYNCPVEIWPSPPGDPRYSNGTIYLRGHFSSFSTNYDSLTLSGSFLGRIAWDAGPHASQVNCPHPQYSSWALNGYTDSSTPCLPIGYDRAVFGRYYCLTGDCCSVTKAQTGTWSKLRRIYR